MALSPGERIGHYKIQSMIGRGGMGEVYRATDLRLKRDVALKVLPAAFAGHSGRMLRFQREAQALASLNHPNIAQIYDIGSDAGRDFIVMEFVAGKTLDQLIGRSGLSVRDALKVSIQIADALAIAHSAGIVHRDLKPANVIVSEDGRVRLLDFGLAKLTEPDLDSNADTATLPAQKEPQTEEGAVLGTVAYMSPEQADGKKVDSRSDIFSFGSVLYEMVTGRRPFKAASRLLTLSEILQKEPPPPGELAPDLPLELEKIILRCLRKDPDRRAQHVGDIKLALEELRDDSASGKLIAGSSTAAAPVRSSLRLLAMVSGAAVLVVAAGVFLWIKRTPPAPARTDWVQITNFPDSVGQPALSPDGRMITFVRGPKTFITPGQVYVKILPSGDPVQLTHDDLPKLCPAFSPDGSRIAYTTMLNGNWDTWLVPVLGGEPRLWLPNAAAVVWIDKSQILLSEIKNKSLHMALETAQESRAGERDLYVPPHERGMVHRSYVSPDGKSILIVEMNERGVFGPCRLLPADGSSAGKQVGPAGAQCTFAGWSRPNGDWMYFSSQAGGAFHTWRQRFPDGQPEQITSGPNEEEGIAVEPDGRALITAVGVQQSSVWLHDRRGDRQISLEGQAFGPQFTPDGKKLCYLIRTKTSNELWIADLDSNRTEPLLPGFPISIPVDPTAAWRVDYDISPDGRQVVFFSPDRDSKFRLWLAPLDRSSPPRQIPGVEGEQPLFGPSGEIFFRKVEGTSAFLYSVREGGSGLRKVHELPVADVFGTSPDRKWLLLGRVDREVILPVAGGTPMFTHIEPPVWLKWTGDGKNVFVFSAANTMAKAYVLPLAPGQILPRALALAKDILSEADLAKTPGVRTIPEGDAVPGPTAETYAFTRETVQRNLYQIPIP